MPLLYKNLDPATRAHMISEMNADFADGPEYISDRLSPTGRGDYHGLLQAAFSSGSDATLARDLASGGRLLLKEPRRTKTGTTMVSVPVTAHETLAEGEFNRYYVRALCLRAIAENRKLKVYRAKSVRVPRPESEVKIGFEVDPVALLADLRANIGLATRFDIPGGPNSGLSVELV